MRSKHSKAGLASAISSVVRQWTILCVAVLSAAPAAMGQLRPDQVLVVYDSRVADSRDVAEYYAGKGKVPEGVNNHPGVRPNVRTVNLATLGSAVMTPGNISYADFITRLRNPLRTHLTNSGLTTRIRAIVLTKGLPHRILDTDNPTIMDFPGSINDEFFGSDVTAASVDTELTLLWQDLSAGENGGPSDSKADGVIINPYWKSSASIASLNNINNTVAKTLVGGGNGPTWTTSGPGTSTTRLVPGDLYLVCRLDGRTVADVRGVIDRAQNVYIDTTTATILLDESGANGIRDTSPNTELDNNANGLPSLWDGDDYEYVRDLALSDGRWTQANVRYNGATGYNNFFLGPRLPWRNDTGIIIVSSPVVMVSSYGANHLGQPVLQDGTTTAGSIYATSYNYANGAVFNTMESFNCRDLGGLGQLPFAVQQQAADFLAAGGTFAVGNVWEPLADSVPDSRYLLTNFLLGTQTWAEASWSSIPSLSWMQLSLGDPLATVQRKSEDMNADGRVNIDDLYRWESFPVDINNNATTDRTDRDYITRSLRAGERNNMLMPR